MVMPNFLVIGAAKAGTTSLYHYLNQHPQIYMTPIKETNFFALEGLPVDFCGPGDQDYIKRFAITDKQSYQEQFQGITSEHAMGEASPLYLYSIVAPSRIRHYIPDVKLIAILRHPVDRAYSSFLHLLRDGREFITDFARSLEEEELRTCSNWEHIWHYRQMGFYYRQLKRYYDLFNRCQIRVYLYDEFNQSPGRILLDIFQFLNVDETFMPDTSIRHNETSITQDKRPPLLPEVRREMIKAYQEDILQLQNLIQIDLSKWLV